METHPLGWQHCALHGEIWRCCYVGKEDPSYHRVIDYIRNNLSSGPDEGTPFITFSCMWNNELGSEDSRL